MEHVENTKSKLNWLRAGVLGANDGIVSMAGLVVGVAGATQDKTAILVAGLAGLVAGAFSMAVGEYVSVSTQRDAEKYYIEKESKEIEEDPEGELEELVEIYEAKGLSKKTARAVAVELTEKDALEAHLELQFGLNKDELTSAWQAAIASAISFTLGGLIPVLAIVLPAASVRVPVTFVAVGMALLITGNVSARMSNAHVSRAMLRIFVGGMLAMIATYIVGLLFGSAGI
jgi:VIT1/CCC1 family predicted Fe2+/Mn2+ transporter